MKYKNIIWDYNGTIIDDAQLAVDAENILLRQYGKPQIDMDFYLKECEMPIINFYKKIYDDLESMDFSKLAKEFVNNYDMLFDNAEVFPEVEEMIEKLHKQGYRQAVISGFETNRLKSSLDKFGLSRYFEFMSGADDIACGDKSERAVQALKAYGFDPHNTLFIGDMYHDYEAAFKSGADCVLIAKGHQGKQVLESYGVVPVLESASQLDEYLFE